MTDVTVGADASPVQAAQALKVAFSRLRRRLREVAPAHYLTPAQASILTRIGQSPGISASTLATAERVRPQSVAATLAALEERQLIERRPDLQDGRRQLVSLSATGRELMEGQRQDREEWLVSVLAEHFTAAERRALLDATALIERISRL